MREKCIKKSFNERSTLIFFAIIQGIAEEMTKLGILIILASGLFFTASSYFGKLVTTTTEMNSIVTSFFRFFIGAILITIYMKLKGASFKANRPKPVIIRAVLNAFGIIMFTVAINYTTITNTNMLNLTYPVFVLILAPFVTGERIKPSSFVYLFVIMAGVYLVSQPSFDHINTGDLIAFASAGITGLGTLYLTEARKHDTGDTIILYIMFIGLILNTPLAFKELLDFDPAAMPFILASAFLGILGQVFLTWGYKYVDSATGSLVSTTRILMAALIGVIFLGEPFTANIKLGILIIFGAVAGLSGYFQRLFKRVRVPGIGHWGGE